MSKVFKNLNYFYFILFFLLFYNNVFGVWLGPATCTDGSVSCGYLADISLGASCSMAGPDISAGNRILGGQICYALGGQDDGGYYMIGTGQPNSNTSIYPFGSSLPWGWSYNKNNEISREFGASSIPTGVFNPPGSISIYYNQRFFDPVPVSVFLPRPDDSSMVSVGSNYVYWTGCNADVRSVYDSSCPSSILMGPTTFNANVGDSISFKVENRLRPNNGYGVWGTGDVTLTFGNLTVCYTSAYFDYGCGSPGCSGRPNYIPTAPGVCSPETSPSPKLDTVWENTGTQNIQIDLVQGQSKQENFIVRNIGEPGSKMTIPSDGCNPVSGMNFITINNCPTNVVLTAFEPIDIKFAFVNILEFLKNSFIINKN